MKNKKFSLNNKDKRVNTIIEIRKSVLEDIRLISDRLDEDGYTKCEQQIIRAELKQIAEMVRDKDKLAEKLKFIEKHKSKRQKEDFNLIKKIRYQVIDTLTSKEQSIVATQYDEEELETVVQELEEIKKMVDEKDKLVVQKNRPYNSKKVNPHISKYFRIDNDHNIE